MLAELPKPERDYLAMLEGLRFGADSAIGVAKDSVYYHGALRMKVAFPNGWDIQSTDAEVFARSLTVSPKNISAQISITPRAANTKRSI